MTDIFLNLLNVSITASWMMLAVLILRLCLKKAPKWITCLLWGGVGLRLILPFSLQSGLSLIPSAQTVPSDIALSRDPAINTGIDVVDKAVNPVLTTHFAPQGLTSINPLQIVFIVLAAIWLAGIAVMLLYGAFSSLHLYRLVRLSVHYRENIYLCDSIDTPFILGILRPRIFLPSGMEQEQIQAVIAHEQAHLKRKDHWWKPLGYTLLAIYWFNPLLWAGYILLCRDVELACDEKVIKNMDAGAKKAYSQALLDCSCNRRIVMACPLAFGEVGVKARIKAVLSYKKPAFWILVVAAMASLVLAVCFLTDPLPCTHEYDSKTVRQPTCTTEGEILRTCKACNHSYREAVGLLAHTYDGGAVIQKPTCTAEGKKEYICSGCGHSKQEAIPMEVHRFGELVVEKEPNCTETGEKVGVCLDCGKKVVAETLPTNDVHDNKTEVIKEATCTEAGEGKITCTRCGKTETCVYEKQGHNYKDGMALPATCVKEGQKQQICKNCGKEQWISTPIDPDGHWWIYNGIGMYYECVYCPERKDDE